MPPRTALALALAALLPAGAAAGAGVTFADGPVITRFSARVEPCPGRDVTCIGLAWRAADRGSARLRFDLVVDHASGRRVFEGSGRFRAGRTLRAALEPRRRPPCGRYAATLTVTDGQGLVAAETRELVRRGGCARPGRRGPASRPAGG